MLPTPVLGVVGLIEDADTVVRRAFQRAGDVVVLLGDEPRRARRQRVPEGDARPDSRRAAGARPAREAALQRLLVDGRRAGADSVGARLRRGRAGGDAGRVLLRHRRSASTSIVPAVAAARRRRSATSRRCSANRRRGSSCRWPQARARRAAGAGAAARRAGRGRSDGSAAIAIRMSIDGRRVHRRAAGRRRSRSGSTAIERYFETVARADCVTAAYTRSGSACSTSSRTSAASSGSSATPRRRTSPTSGLYALQHRGQESAGIASSDGAQIRVSKAMGYVNEAFNNETLAKLPGQHGGRPRPLLHRRREPARQRAADRRRQRPRPARARATTATWSTPASCATRSSARARSSRPAATPRSSSTCSRGRARQERRGGDRRRHLAGARRLLVRHDDQGPADRRARPARLPSAGASAGSATPG